MKDYDLVIDDGNLYLKEYTMTKKMRLTDLAKQLVRTEKAIETPMLPPNCIKFRSNGTTYNEYFIHIPLGTYQLKYMNKNWNVTCPHQIFYFRFGDINQSKNNIKVSKLFWSFDKELNFDSKSFHKPGLQNMYPDCRFCMGDIATANTQLKYVENFITSFFENQFNNDLKSGKRLINEISQTQERKYDVTKKDNEVELAKEWIGSGVNMTYKDSHLMRTLINFEGD